MTFRISITRPIRWLGIIAALTVILYLAGAFAMASFDIGIWGEKIRGLLAFVWTFSVFMSSLSLIDWEL